MKVIGLDLSLTGTGVSVIETGITDEAIWHKASGYHCKHKDRPDLFIRLETIKSGPHDFKHPFKRLEHITNKVFDTVGLERDRRLPEGEPDLWVIEDYFFNPRNPGTSVDLVELGSVIRYNLSMTDRPFITPIASQGKKFATGKGNGIEKALISMCILRDWGIESPNNNAADALVMGMIGVMCLEHGHKIMSKDKKQRQVDVLKKTQCEVLKKILTETPFAPMFQALSS